MKRRIIIVFVLIAAVAGILIFWQHKTSKQQQSKASIINQDPQNSSQGSDTTIQATTAPEEQASQDKKYDLTSPDSITVMVNKKLPLPDGWKPPDLIVPSVPLRLSSSEEQMHFRKIGASDLQNLFTDAKKVGLQLQFGSGYRSEAKQKQFYSDYVASYGKDKADTFSARPGHSEHQTGLTLDFTRTDKKCHLEICFADTEEGKWLVANAPNYGFVLRYLDGKSDITGYQYEPWHFRYVGVELAKEITSSGETLEEFFGTGAAPTY